MGSTSRMRVESAENEAIGDEGAAAITLPSPKRAVQKVERQATRLGRMTLDTKTMNLMVGKGPRRAQSPMLIMHHENENVCTSVHPGITIETGYGIMKLEA